MSAGSSFWKGLLTSTEASRVGLKSRCFKANVFVFLKQQGRAPLACIRTCRATGIAVQHSVSGSVSKPGPGACSQNTAKPLQNGQQRTQPSPACQTNHARTLPSRGTTLRYGCSSQPAAMLSVGSVCIKGVPGFGLDGLVPPLRT